MEEDYSATSGAAATSTADTGLGDSRRRLQGGAAGSQSGKQSSRASKFRNVNMHRAGNRWEAHIWRNKKQVHIGLYPSEVEAAIAFDIVALKMRGPAATTNFEARFYGPELKAMAAMTDDELVQTVRNIGRGASARLALPAASGGRQAAATAAANALDTSFPATSALPLSTGLPAALSLHRKASGRLPAAPRAALPDMFPDSSSRDQGPASAAMSLPQPFQQLKLSPSKLAAVQSSARRSHSPHLMAPDSLQALHDLTAPPLGRKSGSSDVDRILAMSSHQLTRTSDPFQGGPLNRVKLEAALPGLHSTMPTTMLPSLPADMATMMATYTSLEQGPLQQPQQRGSRASARASLSSPPPLFSPASPTFPLSAPPTTLRMRKPGMSPGGMQLQMPSRHRPTPSLEALDTMLGTAGAGSKSSLGSLPGMLQGMPSQEFAEAFGGLPAMDLDPHSRDHVHHSRNRSDALSSGSHMDFFPELLHPGGAIPEPGSSRGRKRGGMAPLRFLEPESAASMKPGDMGFAGSLDHLRETACTSRMSAHSESELLWMVPDADMHPTGFGRQALHPQLSPGSQLLLQPPAKRRSESQLPDNLQSPRHVMVSEAQPKRPSLTQLHDDMGRPARQHSQSQQEQLQMLKLQTLPAGLMDAPFLGLPGQHNERMLEELTGRSSRNAPRPRISTQPMLNLSRAPGPGPQPLQVSPNQLSPQIRPEYALNTMLQMQAKGASEQNWGLGSFFPDPLSQSSSSGQLLGSGPIGARHHQTQLTQLVGQQTAAMGGAFQDHSMMLENPAQHWQQGRQHDALQDVLMLTHQSEHRRLQQQHSLRQQVSSPLTLGSQAAQQQQSTQLQNLANLARLSNPGQQLRMQQQSWNSSDAELTHDADMFMHE